MVVKKDTSLNRSIARNPYAPLDISPIDISYFPADYPLQKMTGATNRLPVARIIYGRPHRQGRKIFGELLKFGEPWRMGANEATELELFQAVTIQGKTIPRGRYILYCIINEDSWTINFNSNLFSWGLKPDTAKNLYTFQAPVVHANQSIEYFTIVFEKASENAANLLVTWDDVIVRLPMKF
ncbi:MAG TPA: DUF2911 domain-containing protein [Chitinophagaceae bacterium]|nr:DUF2911 domain-containing protein [Chitinophagaceae bacterium]